MAIGGFFTRHGISEWYHSLAMPAGTPQDGVFPVVWSILYIMLAISFYLAFAKANTKSQTNTVNSLFINQLFLQILWCFTFFYAGHFLLALLVLIILDLVIFRTIYYFYSLPVSVAAIMLIPYCAWSLFATYLNSGFIYLNGSTINF